jgi:hypothetical protein
LCECELEDVTCEVLGELTGESESLNLSPDCELMKITLPIPVIPKTEFTVEYLSGELGITEKSCRELLSMRVCIEREGLNELPLSDCHSDSAAFGMEAFELLAKKRAKDTGKLPPVLPTVYALPVPERAVRLMKEGTPPEKYGITYAVYRLYRWASHARRVIGMNPPWLVRLNEERMLRERVDALLTLLYDYGIGL